MTRPTNYVIIDLRSIEHIMHYIGGFLKLRNPADIRSVVPVLFAKVDDYRLNGDIWDILSLCMTDEQFSDVDYDTVSYVLENSLELLCIELNSMFNMPQQTMYSFEQWVGCDIKLEIHYDFDN